MKSSVIQCDGCGAVKTNDSTADATWTNMNIQNYTHKQILPQYRDFCGTCSEQILKFLEKL